MLGEVAVSAAWWGGIELPSSNDGKETAMAEAPLPRVAFQVAFATVPQQAILQ